MNILKEYEDTVLISKADYEKAMDRIDWLEWLEAAGVDNWCGIDEAREMMNEQE